MPSVRNGDAFWVDYSLPNFKAIDSTWANWSGTYEISLTETSTPILTGNLTPSTTEGIMQLRLSTDNSSWTGITVGTYKLMTTFTNATAFYREERHDKLVVKTQGM